MSRPSTQDRVDRMLREHEARALAWSYAARAGFLLLGAVVTVLSAETALDCLSTLGLVAIGLTLCVWAIRSTQTREKRLARLLRIGRIGAAYDATVLITLPIVWYISVGGSQVNPAFLLRNETIIIVLVVMVVNTLALRPLYPGIIAAVGVSLQVAAAAYALADSRLVLTDKVLDAVLGSAVKPSFYVWRIIATVVCGFLLTRLTVWARRMIHDVVELEMRSLRLMERQADALMEAKVGAMAKLVAGVAHELNTPLAALVSACESGARALPRLQRCIDQADDLSQLRADKKLQAIIAATADTAETSQSARRRIADLLASLKNFSRLDAVKRESTDLSAALAEALELFGRQSRGEVVVDNQLQALPAVVVDAAAFNQVYVTLLDNAFQAMKGKGTLTLSSGVTDGTLHLEVGDTGPGLSEEQIGALFDLSFAAKQGRMGMGLGLPSAKRTIEAHGGTLSVDSSLGHGARFKISLPLSTSVK